MIDFITALSGTETAFAAVLGFILVPFWAYGMLCLLMDGIDYG
jgi:hypothetical protein